MDIVERLRTDFWREGDADLKEAADEIERLREALKFYANEDHYEPQKVWTTSMPQYEPDGYKLVTPVLADKGARARIGIAIAKATGGEK